MTSKDITIVITTYKSEEKIENCLNSINSEIKVIIVENSNNIKFKTKIEKLFPNVECVLTKENLGYGRANNIGLKMVQSKYSLILNPDTILDKEAINNFFNFIKINENFAILGPTQNENLLGVEDSKNIHTNFFEAESVKGFAMFLNMVKFNNIGFFDENFFLYLEEIDLCKRIKQINEKIFINENIKIFHYGGKSVDQTFSHEIELVRNWHWMWSFFYYNKKHSNYLYAFLIILPKFFSALFKSIFYKFFFKNKKSEIYSKRLSGIFNSIIGKSAWYRSTLD
jgi:N-acetylglucosaminyl-diphospho-decaprenol L-rhamnosyltransferase